MLPASNLPIRTKNFIGRENYLEMIDSAFNKETKQIVVLNSFSGTGKTSIANEYSYRFKSTGFVYWIKPEIGEMNLFASDLGIQLSNEEKQQKSKIIDKIKSNIEGIFKDNADKFNFLFIFDNFDDNDDENDINYIIKLSDITNSKILITTKDKNIKDKFRQENLLECSQFIELEPFDDSESVKFIKQNLNEIIKNEIEVNNLIEFFEIKSQKRRPIALNKMITLIKLKLEKNHSLDTVINDLKLKGKNKLEEIIIDDEFFELIRQKNEESLNILKYTTFLDADFMHMNIFTEMIEINRNQSTNSNFDEDENENKLYKSVYDLEKLSLITIVRKNKDMGLKIHQSIQIETIEYLKNKDIDKYKTILSDYFNGLMKILEEIKEQKNYKWNSQNYYSNFKCIINNFLEDLSIKHLILIDDDYLKIESQMKIYIFDHFTNYLHCNMYFDETIKYTKESLKIKREIHKENLNEEIVRSLSNLGHIYCSIDKYDEALEYFNETFEIYRKIYGDDEIDLNIESPVLKNSASVLNSVATIYLSFGKYDIALEYFNKSLEIYRKIFGTDVNTEIAALLCNIGSLYSNIDNNDRAIKYMNESLEINKKIPGTDLNIAKNLNHIAAFYIKTGNYYEAEKNLIESLKIYKEIYETDIDPVIAETKINIGRIYQKKIDMKKQ